MRSRRDISPQTRRRTTRESSSMSTTSLPISCAARAAATISSPTWTPYWSAIRTWNWASNPRTDQPRRRGSRLMIAWYRTGSSSRATTFGCRAKTSARIAAPMSKTWPTPRSVIIPKVTIPRPTITLCFDEAAAPHDHRENRSRTMRPYIRTMSSARTRPCRTVRCRVRMWWTTARSLPRSTISPISNSSSGAARTSCGTVRFPLLTENLTRTRSIRFAQTVATSFARAAATRRPWASTAVTSIRESPRSSSSPTATFSSGENSKDVRSDLSSHETRDLDRLRFPGDDRGHAATIRTLHGPLEDDLVLASDLAAEHAVGSFRPAHFALEDEGAWRGHRPVERRDGEKDLRRLEPSVPSAVADDAPEPTSQGAGASRTSSRSDERFDPGFPRLRQVRPLRLLQDPLEFGGRGEILDGFDGDETTATAPQGDAHEQGRGREPEDERAHVGLPGDSERPQESEDGFQDEEDHDDLDHGQRRDPGDRQEQGDPVPRVESPVGAEDREDSRGGSDEQDHVAEMHEQEDERSRRPADEEQEGPPRAPDPPLEGGRDQDESEEVQEDVRLRRVHELERDPRPRRGQRSGSREHSEFEGDR